MSVIEVEHLARDYVSVKGLVRRRREVTSAVRDVSFEVDRGEIFGLLGPNGAGKTTTIKVLNTLLLPTRGTARICGHDVTTEAEAVRRRVGYVFGGERGLYDRLSAWDNLRFFATLYHLHPREQKVRIPYLLEMVGLRERAHERVERFSRGMKQRLHIARGLLSDPEVIFLDEPSIGVDPEGAAALRQTIKQLRADGRTLLLTTHYLPEADELCDRLVIINSGQIVASGTPAELKSKVPSGMLIQLEVHGELGSEVESIRSLAGVESVNVRPGENSLMLSVVSSAGSAPLTDLLRLLSQANTGQVTMREASLEDAYLELVSRP